MELAPLTVLKKRYTIKRTLGDPGPFDIKYLGQDVDSKDPYVIREYYPAHLVKRESGKTSVEVKGDDDDAALVQSGMEYFKKESAVLKSLSHPALPDGYETFEANGTAYRARPHRPSMSLASGLESRGTLSEKAALTIMIPILEALQTAHDEGLYHGGVSPQSVRLLEDGNVLLTGFRGAFIQLARQGGKLTELVQPGTSAIEQYTPRGNQGPWTDVYAVAATILQMVTGEDIPEAKSRLEGDDPVAGLIQDAEVFSSPGVREALMDALTVDPSKRLQSAEALATALKESSTRYDGTEDAVSIIPVDGDADEDASGEEEEDVEVLSTSGDRSPRSPRRSSSKKEKSSSNVGLMIGIPIILLIAGGGAWFFLTSGSASADGGTYAEYRSQADSLFASQNYEQAQQYYRDALDVREGDQYVLQRLDRINDVLESDQYATYVSRGDSLADRANRLLGQNQLSQANQLYSQAMAAYFSAQDERPQSQEIEQKIDAIDSRQEQIARRQVSGRADGAEASVDEVAKFFRQQAEEQLQAGNPRAALRKYEQAAEFSPNDQSLQRAISGLRSEIRSREANQTFERNLERGNNLLRQQQYAEAKAAFEEAAQAKPDNRRAQEAVARADSLMRANQQQQQQYQQYRSEADAAYQQGNYEEAIAAYKRALEAKPSDNYAEEQLAKSQRELEELRLAQSKMQKEEERTEQMIGEDGVYKVVDQEPSVKGGLAALHKDVNYPSAASRRGVEGRVYVEAVVNPDGSVREARVTRGIGAGCDREARRVVEDAEFNPATVNGKPVPARTTVWIQFSLQQQ